MWTWRKNTRFWDTVVSQKRATAKSPTAKSKLIILAMPFMLQREVVVWMHFWNCHQTQLLPPSLKTAVSCGNPDTWCELNWYLLKQPWSNLALSPLESMYIYSKELWFHIAFSFGLNKFSAVNLWVGALCIRLHAPVMGWVLGTPQVFGDFLEGLVTETPTGGWMSCCCTLNPAH